MGIPIAKRAEVAERRAEVVRLRARGVPYPEISLRLGITENMARQDAHQAYKQRAAELRENVDEVIAGQVEELEALRIIMWRIALSKHPKIGTSGKAAVDKEGNPIFDDAPIDRAANTIVRIQERLGKLLGSDAALKVDIKAQVVTIDAFAVAVRELEEQVARERALGA